MLVEVAREAIATERVDEAEELARRRARVLLTPVINATGVLLHTNLGRAPLGPHRSRPATPTSSSTWTPGPGAAARPWWAGCWPPPAGPRRPWWSTTAPRPCCWPWPPWAPGRAVAVSRGELVEIGGAFRVPDVMAQSGARLVEVGTTNRTRLADYRRAVEDRRRRVAVLKVHQSNYRIVGFTEETTVAELATLGVPVLADIGSGLLDAACPWLDGPPPRWLDGRARGPPDPGRRRRPGAVLRRQAVRRPPGRDHRRPGRPGGRLRPPSPGPGPAPRRPRAVGPPGHHPGLPAPRRRAPSRSGGWPRSPSAAPRRGPRAVVGRAGRRGPGRRHRGRARAAARCPASPSPAPAWSPRRRPHRRPAPAPTGPSSPGSTTAPRSSTCAPSTPTTTTSWPTPWPTLGQRSRVAP